MVSTEISKIPIIGFLGSKVYAVKTLLKPTITVTVNIKTLFLMKFYPTSYSSVQTKFCLVKTTDF